MENRKIGPKRYRMLSLETSSRLVSIAVLEDGAVQEESAWESLDLGGEIIPGLKSLLGNSSGLKGFDCLVVSLGPGFWTGLRVGISFAKGLAAGSRADIYGVFVPEGLFFLARDNPGSACCLINAYRGRYYHAFSRKNSCFKRPPVIRCAPLPDIVKLIKGKTCLVGPAVPEVREQIKPSGRILFSDRQFWYPRAAANGQLAFLKIRRKIPSPPLEPFYGR